jgi:hypothetical protein
MADIETEVNKLDYDSVKNLEVDPVTKPPPDLTKEQILQVVGLLQRKEENGGYRGISTAVGSGIKASQVKKIHLAMKNHAAKIAQEAIPQEI